MPRATAAPWQALYHGTTADFEKPKPNDLGILWLASNPVIAAEYASPYYHKGASYVWRVELKPTAKIVRLDDLSNASVRALFDAINGVRKSGLGAWTESDWLRCVDFGTLETHRWAARFLRARRLDGVICRDTLSTTGLPHTSVALLAPSAIVSLEKQVIARGKSETIGQTLARANAWTPDPTRRRV
jgi:hypothetical protein